MLNVKCASKEAEKYLKKFNRYTFIWKDDKKYHLECLLRKCEDLQKERDEFDDHKEIHKDIQTEIFQAEVC